MDFPPVWLNGERFFANPRIHRHTKDTTTATTYRRKLLIFASQRKYQIATALYGLLFFSPNNGKVKGRQTKTTKTSITEHLEQQQQSTFSHKPQTKTKAIQLHFRVGKILLLLIQYNSPCSYAAALRIVQHWKNQAFFSHKMEAIRSAWGMHLSTSETLNASTNIGRGNKMEHIKKKPGNRNQSLQIGLHMLFPFRNPVCIKKREGIQGFFFF